MLTKLPQPVQTYFRTTNEPDPAAFLTAFAEDAIALDEGHEYHGVSEIKEWSDRQHFGAQITLEPTNVAQNGDESVVTAKIDGNFDRTGLPDRVLLDFYFIVKDNKISKLTILLTQTD